MQFRLVKEDHSRSLDFSFSTNILTPSAMGKMNFIRIYVGSLDGPWSLDE